MAINPRSATSGVQWGIYFPSALLITKRSIILNNSINFIIDNKVKYQIVELSNPL